MTSQLNKNKLIKDITAYCVIAVAVLFQIATIRQGHDWGGDAALYIMHAMNIFNGLPYSETGFVYNPDEPYLSPKAYPPLFSAFLAPVYGIFGLDLYAMKVSSLLVFGLFLLIFYHYACKRLSSPVAQVLVVATVGFSPFFWEYKDRIFPLFVFTFLVYATVVVMDRIDVNGKPDLRRIMLAILAGIVAYFAYATRSLGIALIPALIMSDVFRRRTIRLTTLVAAVVFGSFYIAQNVIMETDKSYFKSYTHGLKKTKVVVDGVVRKEPRAVDLEHFLSRTLDTLKNNADFYHQNMNAYWANGVSVRLQDVTYFAVGGLAIVGFISMIRRKPSTGDYLLIVYAFILLVVPFLQIRYAIPLLPLYLLYAFHGAEVLFARGVFAGQGRILLQGVIPAVLAGVVLLSYLGNYSTRDFGPIPIGVEVKENLELFDFIRTSVPEDSLIISRKPRSIALYAGRKSTFYHIGNSQAEFWESLAKIGATHIVVANRGIGIVESRTFVEWVEESRDRLDLVFENENFRVFLINS